MKQTARIEIAGVREDIRCPECGRYDTEMGATHEEHVVIKNAVWPENGAKGIAASFEVYCDCYDNDSFNGNCPKCGADMELWDDDQRELFNDGINLTCRCGAYLHCSARVEYSCKLQRKPADFLKELEQNNGD